MNYALFFGCVIPTREPSYEASLRAVFKELGVDLIDLDKATCCAPIPIESLDFKTSLAIAAYNLSLAEEANINIMTICNGCFQVLSKANKTLKENETLRTDINKILAEVGREYKGTVDVVDYLQVLHNDVTPERIKENISKSLNKLRVAAFYGCHVLRPSSVLNFDNPEHPHILDDLIELTEAKSVQYMHKTKCCGGLLRGISDDLASKLARNKLFNISNSKADCIVTVCPFCFLQLDVGQLDVRRRFNETYNLPVFHYPELLGLAMGIDPEKLGLKTHRISTESVLKKIE